MPSAKPLSKLRTLILTARWGNWRKARCSEVVLGLLTDPTRIDPASAIVYNAFKHARDIVTADEDEYIDLVEAITYLNSTDERFQGPYSALATWADMINCTWTYDSGELFLSPDDGTRPLKFRSQHRGYWKWEMTRHIRRAIMAQLAMRVCPPDP